MKTADFFVERLKAWGVKRIFGYSGDGINGVIGALQRDGTIDFIQPRHEEMAAFMAVAHAKFSGRLGVCLATGGPGATHLLTGLYDAKLDHMPVLAICGQAETTVRGGSYQQELNLDRLFADVSEYVQEVSAPAQLPHVVDRAIRLAIARRGPSVVILPKDVQEQAFEAQASAWLHALGSRLFAPGNHPRRGRPATCGGRAQRRRKGGDPDRRRCSPRRR